MSTLILMVALLAQSLETSSAPKNVPPTASTTTKTHVVPKTTKGRGLPPKANQQPFHKADAQFSGANSDAVQDDKQIGNQLNQTTGNDAPESQAVHKENKGAGPNGNKTIVASGNKTDEKRPAIVTE